MTGRGSGMDKILRALVVLPLSSLQLIPDTLHTSVEDQPVQELPNFWFRTLPVEIVRFYLGQITDGPRRRPAGRCADFARVQFLL